MTQASSTINPDIISKEQGVLRSELVSLKNCQITFLTYTVTGSGALLGLAVTLGGTNNAPFPMLGAFYLVPLIIILPFWWIFFDKATTITRIVGYYRILEDFLHSPNPPPDQRLDLVGWENALARFRSQYGEKVDIPSTTSEKKLSRLFMLLILQTSQRYWILAYYTFMSLSLLTFFTCLVSLRSSISERELLITLIILVLGWIIGFLKDLLVRLFAGIYLLLFGMLVSHLITFPPSRISVILLMIAAFIVGISVSRNFVMVLRLSWGEYSYDISYTIWKRVLASEKGKSQISKKDTAAAS